MNDQISKTNIPIGRRFITILDVCSFIVLFSLVGLSPLHWLPSIPPELLHNLMHILLGLYVFLRVTYHFIIQRIRLPISSFIIIPGGLIFSFAFAFRSFTPVGEITNYIFSIGFGYIVLAHVADKRFDIRRLYMLVAGYITVIVIEAVYALLTGILPIPPFALPANVRPFASPVSALSFAGGPNDYTTSVGLALTLTLGFVFSGISSIKWRICTTAVSGLLLASLIFAIVASGGHGRAGLIPVFLLLSVIFLSNISNGWYLPILLISPLVGYFSIFLWVRLLGVPTLVLWLNDFMSNRLLIYDGSIEIMLNNLLGVGFGTFPELYSTPSWFSGQAFGHPVTGAHNIFFTVSIAAGSVAGVLLIYWIISLCKYTTPILFGKTSDIRFPLAAMMIGVLFTGLTVGQMSPFQMYDLLIWWIAFAGCSVRDLFSENNQSNSSHADASDAQSR